MAEVPKWARQEMRSSRWAAARELWCQFVLANGHTRMSAQQSRMLGLAYRPKAPVPEANFWRQFRNEHMRADIMRRLAEIMADNDLSADRQIELLRKAAAAAEDSGKSHELLAVAKELDRYTKLSEQASKPRSDEKKFAGYLDEVAEEAKLIEPRQEEEENA